MRPRLGNGSHHREILSAGFSSPAAPEPHPTESERENESDNPNQFSILDTSTKLRTGFRFPIVGWTHEQLKPKDSLHLFNSLNRKPVVSYVEPSAIENLS